MPGSQVQEANFIHQAGISIEDYFLAIKIHLGERQTHDTWKTLSNMLSVFRIYKLIKFTKCS